MDDLIKNYKQVQSDFLARKEAIIKTIKSFPIIFQKILEETIDETIVLGKKKLDKNEIERFLKRKFLFNTKQLPSSDRVKVLKSFKLYLNELIDSSKNIKISDLIKLKKNFIPSSRSNEETISSFIREFEENELIKSQQIPEKSKREKNILSIGEIKAYYNCGCHVNYSGLIYKAIKDAVERKMNIVELRAIIKIVLEVISRFTTLAHKLTYPSLTSFIVIA